MRSFRWLFVMGCFLFFSLSLSAQVLDSVFVRGNNLYQAGKYQEAVQEYKRILKQGIVSAEIYFNLGNAYYRHEQLAQAILAYERASQIRPNDPDIEHNLKLVYLKTIDRLEPVPDMFLIQWIHTIGSLISTETVRTIFIISWIILFGSLALMYLVLHSEILRVARLLFFASCISTAMWAMMIGFQSFQESSKDKAIVTAHTVTAKSSPDSKSVDAFVIHEGVKVKLTDAVGDWVKITLVDGKVGWILNEQFERI